MRPSLILIALIAFALLYIIVVSSLPGMVKFFLGIAEMFVVGQILIKYYKFTGEYGLIMLRSKKGIGIIHRLARQYEKIWKFLSDTGVVISYGLLSFFLMRKHVSAKSLITGLVLLSFIFIFVAPAALGVLISLLGVSMIERSSQQLAAFSPIFSLSILLVLIGGLFLFFLLGLIAYGLVILAALLSTLLQGTAAISQTTPGAHLLLPGINLPFFEGILALLIILVVHEGAHAVMARIGKIPILSSGLVLFGVIPIGAFVEPDEKKLKKLERTRQTRVLVAGSTANLIASILLFTVFLGFITGINYLGLVNIEMLIPVLRFISIVLGLGFALNFVIGTVNLLPLPFFDGYRTMEINVPQKNVLRAITIITLVAFLLNFLPWLFVA
ncbi:MAG TPA: site-2 protease family protein [Candidatus Bilamarchaeaceae archaeon]|nr:site-2 protease family protein [Candidatus Bilamarchaeaceae archaeon]